MQSFLFNGKISIFYKIYFFIVVMWRSCYVKESYNFVAVIWGRCEFDEISTGKVEGGSFGLKEKWLTTEGEVLTSNRFGGHRPLVIWWKLWVIVKWCHHLWLTLRLFFVWLMKLNLPIRGSLISVSNTVIWKLMCTF